MLSVMSMAVFCYDGVQNVDLALIPSDDLKQGVTDCNSQKFVLYTEMCVQEHQPTQWDLFFKCSLFNMLAL